MSEKLNSTFGIALHILKSGKGRRKGGRDA